jgi:hypothetical protein
VSVPAFGFYYTTHDLRQPRGMPLQQNVIAIYAQRSKILLP